MGATAYARVKEGGLHWVRKQDNCSWDEAKDQMRAALVDHATGPKISGINVRLPAGRSRLLAKGGYSADNFWMGATAYAADQNMYCILYAKPMTEPHGTTHGNVASSSRI